MRIERVVSPAEFWRRLDAPPLKMAPLGCLQRVLAAVEGFNGRLESQQHRLSAIPAVTKAGQSQPQRHKPANRHLQGKTLWSRTAGMSEAGIVHPIDAPAVGAVAHHS
jgi:hypothetical protein